MAKKKLPPWQNRTVEHAEVNPADIVEHPRNWRSHPKHQRQAMADVLDDIGWIQDIIINKRTGFMLDGHLRVALAIERKEATVPVKYIDLDEEEDLETLAVLDPLGAMAIPEKEALDSLLKDVSSGKEGVNVILDRLRREIGQINIPRMDGPTFSMTVVTPGDIQKAKDDMEGAYGRPLSEKLEVVCPHCTEIFYLNKADICD